MVKRMQVLVEEAEYARFQAAAKRAGLTLAAWVRRTLRDAWRTAPLGDRERKLEAIRSAAGHAFPTADIDRMLEEIEQGYGGPPGA